jgi:hypothetical protein
MSNVPMFEEEVQTGRKIKEPRNTPTTGRESMQLVCGEMEACRRVLELACGKVTRTTRKESC